MANLQIKNVPEPIHSELRRRAAQREMTVRDYVLQLILADQARPSQADWLAQLDRDPHTQVRTEEILVELDRGRRDREERAVCMHRGEQ